MSHFQIGDRVEKIEGEVRFPGIIVANYTSLSGRKMIVVECTVPGVEGLQHIYRPEQFRKVDAAPDFRKYGEGSSTPSME